MTPEKKIFILTKKSNYPIKPEQIDTRDQLLGSFGMMETEVSAMYVTRLAQMKKDWLPFTELEMQKFFETQSDNKYGSKNAEGKFLYNGLLERIYTPFDGPVGGGYLVRRRGRIHFTNVFVDKISKGIPMNQTGLPRMVEEVVAHINRSQFTLVPPKQ